MLMDAQNSVLLLIDLQERLMPVIDGVDKVLEHNVWLVKVAKKLSVPIMMTVQNPKGLGPTVSALSNEVAPELIHEKIHFSAIAEGCLGEQPGFSRSQVILTGAETHVCVLQTALELRALGKQVFVVAEAVGSRRPEDRQLGLERLRQEGCRIVSREMVAFEWLRRAGTDLFRQVSREFLR